MKYRKLKVYEMNEYYWWADFNKKDAIKNFRDFMGTLFTPDCDIEANPRQLTDKELDELQYADDPYNKPRETISYRERLSQITEPDIFACSTEVL
jgi:hypothetical protein